MVKRIRRTKRTRPVKLKKLSISDLAKVTGGYAEEVEREPRYCPRDDCKGKYPALL